MMVLSRKMGEYPARLSSTKSFQTVLLKDLSSTSGLLLIYRYASLSLTSFFYLLSSQNFSFPIKLLVVIILSASSLAMTHLSNTHMMNRKRLKLLIIAELSLLIVFVFITGGIESPFIWYSLIPILMAISYLPILLSWGMLLIFLTVLTLQSMAVVPFIDIMLIVKESLYIYLVILLGVILAHLFFNVTKELDQRMVELQKMNGELIKVNSMHQKTIEQVMTLNKKVNRYSTKLAVLEEQNRIANEIHDHVSQKLFGLVYSLHNLQTKYKEMELSNDLHFLGRIANDAMKELRAAIYRLSSVKKGEQPVLDQLQEFLDDFGELHGIKLVQQVSGNECFLSFQLKEALLRILSEACGNAVRHGKCKEIFVSLVVTREVTLLEVHDNGIGMTIHKSKEGEGIGLHNIRNIVLSFDGVIAITSEAGKGTSIQIEIPNQIMKKVVGS